MAIFLTENSRVIVQGMTGSEGGKHTRRMLAAGTNVVGGVTPGKGGQSVDFDGRATPVFNSVKEAMTETGADVTVVFVPPKFAKAAVIEAVDAGIGLAVVITEGIPVHDTTEFWAHSQGRSTRIIGPNCPGLISPGRSNVGIIPADIARSGRIGLVSKCTNCGTSASPPVSASVETRSSAPPTSTAWQRSRTTRTPTRS